MHAILSIEEALVWYLAWPGDGRLGGGGGGGRERGHATISFQCCRCQFSRRCPSVMSSCSSRSMSFTVSRACTQHHHQKSDVDYLCSFSNHLRSTQVRIHTYTHYALGFRPKRCMRWCTNTGSRGHDTGFRRLGARLVRQDDGARTPI